MNDFNLLIAQYNASLPTLADGCPTGLQVDVNGRLLVQADVTVLVDFLGLNGAADSANILIVGTEDGTAGGTPHVIKVDSDGSICISDCGGSITVDAVDLDIRDLAFATDSVTSHQGGTWIIDSITNDVNISDGGNSITIDDGGLAITVDASDLDIRDLTHVSDSVSLGNGTNLFTSTSENGDISLDVHISNSDLDIRDLDAGQDNIAISDGTDTLEVNSDGSINVNVSSPGSEQYSVSDALAAGGVDGLITITALATPFVTVASLSHVSGTAYIYGYQWACDQNAQAQLVYFDGTDEIVYKNSVNSSAFPGLSEHFSEGGRIEIPGVASGEIRLKIKKRIAQCGDANGTGSIHIRTV